MIKPEFNRRDIRSFVIRSGRMTAAQEKAFEHHWPRYALFLKRGLINPDNIFPRRQPLVLEIGYGMGDSLLEMAQRQPEKNFIGIEVHSPGVGHLVNEAARVGLDNLKTYCADAIDVLTECFSENAFERIQLYFPDPWHKKRHHKRRIVQLEFARLVYKRLQAGGIFHLCTDWVPYAEQMLAVLQDCPDFENLSPTGDYCERPVWRPETKFERRGEQLGHEVRDLMFRKQTLV